MFVSKFGFSQNQIDGTVRSVIELGLFKYCIIQQDGTNNYYKSSTYSSNIFLNQELKIDTTYRKDNRVVLNIPDVNEIVLAQKLGSSINTYLMTKIGSELPNCIDGTLFFTDTTQLRIFIELVSNEYLTLDDDSETRSLKLDSIQNLFPNFISYKNYFINKYDYENGEFTEKEIEDMNKEDFINDDVLKSIFNEFKFIGVGDSIYYYHSIDEVISFNSEDDTAYVNTKRISQLENAIDYDVFGINSEFFKNDGQYNVSSTKKKKNKPKGTGTVSFSQSISFQTIVSQDDYIEDCSRKRGIVFELFLVNGTIYSDYNQPFNSKITIDWKDGTIEEIYNYIPNTSQKIIHEYQTPGVFFPTTLYEFEYFDEIVQIYDGNGTGGILIKFDTQTACAKLNKQEPGYEASGNWMLMAEIWANTTVFGSWLGSSSDAWEKQNNGSYKKSKARIYTQVEGNFLEDDCVIRKFEDDDKERSNDKSISVRESRIFQYLKIKNGDVKSRHFLKKGNVNIELNLVLNPCQ